MLRTWILQTSKGMPPRETNSGPALWNCGAVVVRVSAFSIQVVGEGDRAIA